MTARAELRLAFDSPDAARRVAAALAPDDAGFLDLEVAGEVLVARVVSDSPLGLLRTLDEVLVCAGAAEKAVRIGEPA